MMSTDCARIEAALANETVLYRATQILSALADSTRFKILLALSHQELCVCELQELCGVSQSAISHQLRLLRDRDLVAVRKDGQRSVYSLNDEHVNLLIEQVIAHASHVRAGI